MKFTKEHFTPAEEAILGRYFTNTDLPVFGLVNMPDVVKGALFARYSRSNKSLRRLFLDEFYEGGELAETVEESGNRRAEQLYDKMILDFGDDSVAQLGGAHLACEQVSNILTKVLEKGRIASYLEQSTRYVYYNEKVDGQYRYMVPPEVVEGGLEKEYRAHLDLLFDTYTEILEDLLPALRERFPISEDQTPRAWEATIRAKACDIIRGLLPASTRSNMGIYASGQSYEYMLVKMFSCNNSEVREYAAMMLTELRKIIPSFLKRVDLPDRGVAWSRYLAQTSASVAPLSKIEAIPTLGPRENEVHLLAFDADARQRIERAILFEYSSAADGEISATEAPEDLIRAYCGNRLNRRHKPGRAFEMASYTFEILSDYGAFRDLQRHRLLTIQWQQLSPRNGYIVPPELDEYPPLREKFVRAIENTSEVYSLIKTRLGADIAQYVVPFACRLRYRLHLNLREAFHLIELRTQKQGHPSYRQVCITMHDLIMQQHPFLRGLLSFVDTTPTYTLPRTDAETARDKK